MTDTTVAAPPPAPTPVNETPINPNPPSSPTPVGSQAPPAPVGDLKGREHRPLSRREAIQAAFDRATRQQDGKETKVKGVEKADLNPRSLPRPRPATTSRRSRPRPRNRS